MPTKDETIARVYDDFAGHGDLLDTYRKAKKLDPTITMKDVANWRERNLDKKKQLHGYNSFVASAPREEYQLDMWFMRDNPDLDDYKLPALIMVDIFTKMTFAIAIDNKNSESVEKGVRQMMTWMKGTPETLYTDDEAAFSALNMRNYYEEHNIRHIITRTHAPVAERQIRTFKDMIFKRLDRTGSKDWRSEQFLYNIALVYNGMRQHRTTGNNPAGCHETAERSNGEKPSRAAQGAEKEVSETECRGQGKDLHKEEGIRKGEIRGLVRKDGGL